MLDPHEWGGDRSTKQPSSYTLILGALYVSLCACTPPHPPPPPTRLFSSPPLSASFVPLRSEPLPLFSSASPLLLCFNFFWPSTFCGCTIHQTPPPDCNQHHPGLLDVCASISWAWGSSEGRSQCHYVMSVMVGYVLSPLMVYCAAAAAVPTSVRLWEQYSLTYVNVAHFWWYNLS